VTSPFANLFNDPERDSSPVSLDGSGAILTRRAFRGDVAALTRQLQDRPERRWAVCFADSYWFAVSLFAALFAGRDIVIPGNITSRQALLTIQDHYDAVLGDLDIPVKGLLLKPAPGPPSPNPARGSIPRARITLFTSGSTSAASAIDRTFQDLENEIVVLKKLFGSHYANREVFASVSHQHIYGLLFRVLLPLAAGAPFSSTQLEYPDQVCRSASANRILVSSPAILKRLPDDSLENGYHKVFSSGGPLPLDAARHCRGLFGSLPIEVYGSSETGGIAWREQSVGDQPWQTFPGIEVRSAADGCLEIRSPFMAADGWHLTQDRIDLLPGGIFRLIGRVDRVVKISEKRLSLIEIEQRLQEMDAVEEAVMVPLQTGGRLQLGAVVRLTEVGQKLVRESGRRAFASMARRFLADYLEPAGIPRRFRLVDEIPVDSQGKHVLKRLEELFES
jgi:acyl-coenzyme A synthetase/AMP-(fatty) acid ligase